MKLIAWQSGLPLGLILVLACADSSFAVEQMTIAQLQQYQQSYHLRSVKVVGRVEQMHPFPPRPVAMKRCRFLYGIAEFVLIDDTGSLPVETIGSCLTAAGDLPHDGDQIEATVQVHVSASEGGTKQVIKAIVQEIVVVK
jgi:hypothetical protein